MNFLPNTPTTVANWPLNGTTASGGYGLADISGHGLNFTVEYGTEQYDTVGSFTAFRGDNGVPGNWSEQNALIAPVSALLQIGGELTVQGTWYFRKTNGSDWLFDCRHGSNSDDRLDPSLYTGTIPAVTFAWRDHVFTGAFAPGCDFIPETSFVPYVRTQPVFLTFRKRQTGSNQYVLELFVDGVYTAAVATPTTFCPPFGDERFRLCGIGNNIFFAGPKLAGLVGSVRVSTGARSDEDITHDFEYVTLGTPYPPSDGTAFSPSVTFAADTGRFYRLRPGHMPQLRGVP